jgi:hypothetical protein
MSHRCEVRSAAYRNSGLVRLGSMLFVAVTLPFTVLKRV